MLEATRAIVRIDRLTSTINGKTILSDLQLTLRQNGVTAIMGFNGSGKSTLLRVLAGLIGPTAGTVSWQLPATAEGGTERAVVFQRPVILRRSVTANIRHALSSLALPADELRQRIADALDACRLAKLQDTPARRLSGGEQQRLAMARALARNPQVLLLDEPTANLDPSATRAIEQIIRNSAAAGTRVIIVTHDAAQARRLADDVVFLAGGRVVEHSPAAKFFDNPDHQTARDFLAGRLTEGPA